MQRCRPATIAILGIAYATGVVAGTRSEPTVMARAGHGTAALPTTQQLESSQTDPNPPSLASEVDLRAARAHLEASSIDATVATYRDAVQRLEAESGVSDVAMVAALTQLGHALLRSGLPNEAIATLERAIRMSRRADGLFDLSQVEALETLAAVHAEAGRFDVADSLHRYLIQIYTQQFGAEDTRTARAIATMATFKRGAGHYLDARSLYQRAISIIESDQGPFAPALIDPLSGLADAYRREALGLRDYEPAPDMISPADKAAVNTRSDLLSAGARRHAFNRRLHPAGLGYLNRALEIAEREVNAVEPTAYHALLVQVGDWLLLVRDVDEATQSYGRALALESRADIPSHALNQVAPVYLALPSIATRHKWLPAEEVHESFAVIDFDVAVTGKVEDVRVVESNASAADERAAIRAFRQSIYRPKFVGGEPVRTEHVRHRLVFRKRI